MNEARQILRTATARYHERVDTAFAGFDLAVAASYRGFLTAHARVLPAVERAVGLPWQGSTQRATLLFADLADLGVLPDADDKNLPAMELPARWGGLYVLEGSRLGGSVLANRVGPGLPRRYLSAGHSDGSWKTFLDALKAAAKPDDESWMASAIGAARSVFELFEEAATLQLAKLD